MNYGRYFRLNQALSKVISGVAVYDYIDLPAYLGPSEDNPMSPKYPISVTITSDSVLFRLHYGAYKLEKKEKLRSILLCSEKVLLTDVDTRNIYSNDFPRYAYDIEDLNEKSIPKVCNRGLTDLGMAHMEEVILELPFTDIITGKLSQTLKDIYNTTFPQSIENTSTGGRFLEQLINKRYPKAGNWKSLDDLKKKGDVEDLLYGTLREASDNSPSYSTLWLMDLIIDIKEEKEGNKKGKKEKKNKRIELYNSKGQVVAFLRKLLLDFMFDLKHSDVFQNSADYQKMYSGLMSDFYFSALMHKCEYYYCRKLVLEEINHLESAKKDSTDKDKIEKKNNCIKVLYANNLFRAEQVWVNDIMSPQAEKDFDFLHPKPEEPKTHANNEKKSFISKIKAFCKVNNLIRDQFRRWNSWFAPPEEEMIRVCFGMEEENSLKIHICNTDTLASYLNIDNDNINNNDDDKLDKELGAIRSEIRESISRWFLRRNDFHDTARLHLSKYSNWALVGFLLVLVILLYFIPIVVTSDYYESAPLKSLQHYVPMCVMLMGIAIVYGISSCCWSKKEECNDNPLYKESRSLSKRRVKILFVGLALLSIVINSSWMTIAIIFLLIIACSLKKIRQDYMRFYFNKLISCLHLFFPRLVASITTAWLTITLGFDLYSSFFDKPISWPTAFFVSIVILMFIMFEINQITPRVNLRRKILRSLELLLISWCISILVGVVVIDFVGERYIERGGYIENFFAEYVVDENGVDKLSSPVNTDSRLRTNMVDDLTDYKPIVVKFILGEHDVFYMRDFLFMFSFITMFMGIFLQMFIFDDKKMTEF